MSAVRFLRGTVIGTGRAAGAGEVCEIDDDAARFFVAQGRAVYVDGTALPTDTGALTVADTPKPKASRTR